MKGDAMLTPDEEHWNEYEEAIRAGLSSHGCSKKLQDRIAKRLHDVYVEHCFEEDFIFKLPAEDHAAFAKAYEEIHVHFRSMVTALMMELAVQEIKLYRLKHEDEDD